MNAARLFSSRALTLLLAASLSLAPSGCNDDEDDQGKADSTPASDLGLPQSDGHVPAQDSGPQAQDGSQSRDGQPGSDQQLVPDGPLGQDAAPQPDQQLPDTRPPADLDPPLPDFGGPPSTTTVAAIQYAAGRAMSVPGCVANAKPDLCAIKKLVIEARAAGASVVVGPEYALFGDQEGIEPNPPIGSNPGSNPGWPDDLFIKIFSKQANQLDIYLVVNLLTYSGSDPNYKFYNSQVAFDPSGKVVGLHHKFELFGNETQNLDAGTDVMVFDTPLGKMGLLICADIYGSSTLLDKLAYTLDARVVAFSSYWTVTGAVNWQEGYAQKYGVYLIAANTVDSPGQGGGIYDPNGDPIVQEYSTSPSVVVGEIPLP